MPWKGIVRGRQDEPGNKAEHRSKLKWGSEARYVYYVMTVHQKLLIFIYVTSSRPSPPSHIAATH